MRMHLTAPIFSIMLAPFLALGKVQRWEALDVEAKGL